jgi:hypothetical protein
MDGNEAYGDCVYASKAHWIMMTTANGDGIVVPSVVEVLNAYASATGFNPFDPATDQGDTLAHGMEFMCRVGMSGQKVDAFAEVDFHDIGAMKQSIHLMGGIDLGVQLPRSAMEAFGKTVWSDTSDTDIMGGHCVPVFAYDQHEVVLVTWGASQIATWEWVLKYADEAVAPIFFAWVQNSENCTPDNFNRAQLEADLRTL